MTIADVSERAGYALKVGGSSMGGELPVDGEAEDRLVAEFLAGRPEAFDRLVLAYRERVYALARLALGDREDAQDVAQETFVRACAALPRYSGCGQFRAWLFRICVNLCRNRLKARRAPVPLDGLDEEPPDPHPGPEERALTRERALAVREAIAGMSDRDRLIVILYYQNDLSLEEIARVIGCRVGTAKVALHRARGRLRARLEQAGFGE